MDKRGPWQVLETRLAYENPWMRVVDHDVIRPDGKPGRYGVMVPANYAIIVLPVHDDGTITLVGQHRFATDRYEWELPEGGGPKTDTPLDSAQRELREETGLTATHWKETFRADLSNSITDETGFGFIAWGLTEGEPDPDGTEILATQRLAFLEAVARAAKGEYRDMPTVAMLMLTHYMAVSGQLEEDLTGLLLGQGRGSR
ncbi:NUDIX hydrolase [Hyphobacterium marinum]|uniref:NUDIX hydrolase n=1 Tax=Hyphobacterium marinum TaxID=3116574 RepID=A0ABU7M0Z5_9PROT|nr:NUDIX hydrolase [Hyphobacterium sp. Y6023]MEE2567070.1 NUDIX hydrolase [Hyphobacterium sp. Y6023]